jgi:formylglycine-generating enzyme required for sulfatase activity
LAVLSGMTGACGDRRGTSPVGTALDGASPFGVLDMGGNVWEWVADDYAAYPSNDVTDPLVTITDRSEVLRGILRGGSWDYGPESAKTTYRMPFVAEAGNASTGIRCARTE